MVATITNQINTIIDSVLSYSPDKLFVPKISKPDGLQGVDDLIHAGFEAYRASCFNWLLAATGVVVVGLVLEGPELWHEITAIIRHWRFSRSFHFSLPEEHPPNWVKLFAFVGWLFIVLGVAGEYVADSFVSKADGYVQTFDEVLLTEARKDTALAKERAGSAYERASENEKEAAQLRQEAALIELSLARRTLAPSCETLLATSLPHFNDRDFWVMYNTGDAEGKTFAWEIAVALHDRAKLKVFGPSTVQVMHEELGVPFDKANWSSVTGLVVSSTKEPESRDAAKAVLETFVACGFDAKLSPDNLMPSGTVFFTRSRIQPTNSVGVRVETRPEGPQGEAKLKLEAAKKK